MADIRRIRRRFGRNYRVRVEHVIPDRQNPLEYLRDDDIFSRFRFSRETIYFITGLVAMDIQNATDRGGALPPLLMVLITLRYLATGTFESVIGDLFNVAQSTVSRTLRRTLTAFAIKAAQMISFPNDEDARRVKAGFFEVARKCFSSFCLEQIRISL